MPLRIRPWHLALFVVVLGSAVTGALYYVRLRNNNSLEAMVARLPARGTTVLFVDIGAIREAGLLALLARVDGSQETEYLDFVERTGFDYSRDLRSALISFGKNETFALLQGHFDWARLIEAVTHGGGACYNGFCQTLAGSTDRWISFFAVTPWVMAIAASEDPWAASALLRKKPSPLLAEIPGEPVWLQMPGAALGRASWLPAGSRAFVSPIADAEQVALLVGPAGPGIEARLNVTCRSPEEAVRLAKQLQEVTEALRRLIRLEAKAPNPRDLSGVLTAGTFHSDGPKVVGKWPLPAEFLEALAAGTT